MALFLGGLGSIPETYYEYAKMEGAGKWKTFWHITLVYLTPTLFIALILSFVNSFKVFKEIYILTGEYPSESLYVLQHFMNRMFLRLDYPKLSAAVYILTAGIAVFLAAVFRAEKTASENLRE